MSPKTVSLRCAIGAALFVTLAAHAADVTVQPAAGSGFVVKDAAGTNERLRVNENGSVMIPAAAGGAQQATPVCTGMGGLLGPCSSGSGGGSYSAGAGLALSGGTFSVAPTFQLPQSCADNQIAQWNAASSVWVCASASGATLPAGMANQTLRYDGGNALAATDDLKVFADGGVLATNAAVNAAFANNQTPTGTVPASGPGARLMWYPAKAAFRAGYVDSTQWDDAKIGRYSIAMGWGTTASGVTATAMGSGTTAGCDTSKTPDCNPSALAQTAMGEGTTASGTGSTAMGLFTTASGEGSTAMGNHTSASSIDSTAMGDSTTASGAYSTAMGWGTAASGDYSTAMGDSTKASGTHSTAMGVGTTASGTQSTAMGSGTVATGNGSTAMGINARTHVDGAGNEADGSFVYGDGTAIVKNSYKHQFMVLADSATVFYSGHGVNADQSDWPGVVLTHGAGAWSTLSDRAAKDALAPVDARAILDRLVALPMTTWHYKQQDPSIRHIGAIAQDFHAAFNVGEDERHISTVDADGVALAAIQGLNAKLEQLVGAQQRQLVAQREQIAALQAQAGEMAALKAAVNALQHKQIEPLLTAAAVQP